jgi:predicted MPP superfamily phosphohydrolase
MTDRRVRIAEIRAQLSHWKIATLAILAVLSGLLFWSIGIEPGLLRVHREDLRLERLPPELEGLRVAVLSDLHVGAPHIDLKHLQAVVDKTNAAHPEVVLLLGDYVILDVLGGRLVPIEPIAKVLGGLHAPLGTYAILGNHDWWYDGERVRASLAQVGIRVLENESVCVDGHGRRFWIGGLGDAWTRVAHIPSTLRPIPARAPVILLSHNPDVFPEVPESVLLTLAGHTHGGQVHLPILGSPIVPSRFRQRYVAGHIIENGKHLFVTVGIGTSIVPVRFCVPPEIAVLTLKRG